MRKHNIIVMKKLIKVPYIDQTKQWPTGCESVSSVMLLQYLGVEIGVNDFIETYLEMRPFTHKDGKTYGPNPRKYFVGSPYDSESMGCYAPVIVNTLNKVFEDEFKKNSAVGKRHAVDITGMPMEEILSRYIDQDIPVVFWASIDLKETVTGPEWILDETGEVFTWKSNEHCMLLVGYDEKNYYFNDPWHNHGVIGYDRALVEKRHGEQYEMAVGVEICHKI